MILTDDDSELLMSLPLMSLPSPSPMCHKDVEMLEKELEKEHYSVLQHIQNLSIHEPRPHLEISENLEKKHEDLHGNWKLELRSTKRQLESLANIWSMSKGSALPKSFGPKKRSPFIYPFKFPRIKVKPTANRPNIPWKGDRYKTALCVSWMKSGMCNYGWRCRYAHGQRELRTRLRPKYGKSRTRCNKYHLSGYCPYGRRCRFVHNTLEKQ